MGNSICIWNVYFASLTKFDIVDRKAGSILRSPKSMWENWAALFWTERIINTLKTCGAEIHYWMRKLLLLGATFFGLKRPLQSYDIISVVIGLCEPATVICGSETVPVGRLPCRDGPAVSQTVTRRGLCVLEWIRHQLQVGWWGDLQSREGSMKIRGDADCFFLRIARTEGI